MQMTCLHTTSAWHSFCLWCGCSQIGDHLVGCCSQCQVLAGTWEIYLVEAFECKYRNLKMLPCFYWQPVQLHKYWGDMVEFFVCVMSLADNSVPLIWRFFRTYVGMPRNILLLLSNFDVTNALIRVDATSSVKYFLTLLMLFSWKYEAWHTLFTWATMPRWEYSTAPMFLAVDEARIANFLWLYISDQVVYSVDLSCQWPWNSVSLSLSFNKFSHIHALISARQTSIFRMAQLYSCGLNLDTTVCHQHTAHLIFVMKNQSLCLYPCFQGQGSQFLHLFCNWRFIF